MNTLILFGSSGLLGSNIERYAGKYFKVIPFKRGHVDLLTSSVDEIKQRFYNSRNLSGKTIILNCAAITQAKMKEHDKGEIYQINVKGPGNLCLAANKLNDALGERMYEVIQISTDYVFDGLISSEEYYDEEAIPEPLNFYAYTKSVADEVVMTLNHRVIRTSFCSYQWPYSHAFIDKYSTFDTVDLIANLIIRCIDRLSFWYGILNVGTEKKTFFDLAKRLKHDVKPNSFHDVSITIPGNTCLDNTKMLEVLGDEYDSFRDKIRKD